MGDTAIAASYAAALPAPELEEFRIANMKDALLATLHARVAAIRGNWEQAARILAPVTGDRTPRDARREATTTQQLSNWLMAEAAEALGDLEGAVRLYSGVAAGHRFSDGSVHGFGLTYSFAHRKAALLYSQLEDYDRAAEHWLAFLDAFTDPDPEFEWMVEEARSELERLGRGR
jgi:hypothetical protein